MTLEHATTKTSGFRFTLAHSRGVFYEGRATECVTTQRRPDQKPSARGDDQWL